MRRRSAGLLLAGFMTSRGYPHSPLEARMLALYLPVQARSLVTSRARRLLRFAAAAVLGTVLAACDEAIPPTASREPANPASASERTMSERAAT